MCGVSRTRRAGSALPVRTLLLACCAIGVMLVPRLDAQDDPAPADQAVYVDEAGVMRWSRSGEEVALFGVNYAPAFAHGHRALSLLGKDHKEAIDEDTYHFSRLGVDAYRIHMWDTEITDSLGNLLENVHLDLHEYTISRMKERGIKTILTPITYYTNGYPDGATPTPGFANYISKAEAPRNPDFRPVLENYLEQLVAHVNPYTGMSAIDDPDIIGLEIVNEPSHSDDVEATRQFVDELANHLRAAGWSKPIFYNASQNVGVIDAFWDADIEGLTFQWYPAGLVGRETIRKNTMPHVNTYPLPWEDDRRFQSKALIVYEFDAADVANNYALPMMARSFREAGFQWATQFAYDPLALAHVNTEYHTHYLNMVYTPGKAVSALIAAEIFRRIDRKQPFNDFPADTAFGDFLVSHARNLSQLNADDAFLHSNQTEATPRDEDVLERVAGVGSSPIVSYPGTGAYFLDKLDDGVWRLEVLPDAIEVRDPFDRPAFDKRVVHIEWRQHPMQIRLSDLAGSFTITPLNEGNEADGAQADDGSFDVSPGAYLLTRSDVDSSSWTPASTMGAIQVGEYHAPHPGPAEPVVRHTPVEHVEAGRPVIVKATVAGLGPEDTVWLQASPDVGRGRRLEMEEVAPYTFEAEIPGEVAAVGTLQYWIVVDREDGAVSFPGGNPGAPWQWNYHYDEMWQTTVLETGAPIEIYDAGRDYRRTQQGFGGSDGEVYRSALVSTDRPGRMAHRVSSTAATADRQVLGLSTYVRDRLAGISPATMASYRNLVVRAKADYALPADLKVVLVDVHGNSYSAPIPVTETYQAHRIPLRSFESDRFMLLPRSYPSITPSWFETGIAGPLVAHDVEEIQFYIDTSELDDSDLDRYGFEIESAWLER